MSNQSDIHRIQADFDRLASFSDDGWDHNSHYHHFLLKHLPLHGRQALEIGCGTGAFSRLLARRFEHVLALDLSPQMIHLARERSQQYTNIDFQVADALSWEFPAEQFDCIASIATLHHLPMEEMLSKMKTAISMNGTLLVLDLFQAEGLFERFTSATAFPIDIVLKYLKTGRLREPPEVRKAWAEHGKWDAYLTLSQIRSICTEILPGARVKKHLLWRYSLIWQKDEL
jgi:ubiquinone/menaquinone biosynthesis C-methylase UbiE